MVSKLGQKHYTFLKQERLARQKSIERLFKEGKRIHLGALRFVYLASTELSLHQWLFAVPKKEVRKAVDRNRIKRQMKEACRHTKQGGATIQPRLLVACIYRGLPTAKHTTRYTSFLRSFAIFFEKMAQKSS